MDAHGKGAIGTEVTMSRLVLLLAGSLLVVGLAACGGEPDGERPAPSEDLPPITNRIDVPPAVRRNLGITFAKVELRAVARTRRVPGHFEPLPEARQAYQATLAGQVELRVSQYQRVAPGDVLFRVDSPAWREMQHTLSERVMAIRSAKARLDALVPRSRAVAEHGRRLVEQQGVWEQRVRELKALGEAGAGVRSELTGARAELAAVATALAEVREEEAELAAQRAEFESEVRGHREATPLLFAEAVGAPVSGGNGGAAAAHDLALARAAALVGIPVPELSAPVGDAQDAKPLWRSLDRIDVVAREGSTVEALEVTNGAWVEVGELVLKTRVPGLVRFRASGLQADLAALADGLRAAILPPGGGAAGGGTALPGVLTISLEADPMARKIDLLVTPDAGARPGWARAGVSSEAEIVLRGTSEPALAVPQASVIQDGLSKIVFRRDPKDPDKVIRLEADVGISDGRWVVLASGVMEGDEVVHHGVYELMLASGSAKQQGGHFHADGTWHAGSDH